MLKVVELKPNGVKRQKVLEDLLLEVLEEVQAGDLVELGIVGVYKNRDTDTWFQGEPVMLLGALARLMAHINNDMDENR